jgi:hypothetical protein
LPGESTLHQLIIPFCARAAIHSLEAAAVTTRAAIHSLGAVAVTTRAAIHSLGAVAVTRPFEFGPGYREMICYFTSNAILVVQFDCSVRTHEQSRNLSVMVHLHI